MRIAVFSSKPYVQEYFDAANAEGRHELVYFEDHLSPETAEKAEGFEAICPFVNDDLQAGVLIRLSRLGVKILALRSAGFNNVDLVAAKELGLTVCRVPEYSPYSVAEHTVGLMLSLNRKISRAYARVREGNFSLDGLLGFEMHGRTVGIVGTGRIGTALASILKGFGCRMLAYDVRKNPECEELGVEYVDLEDLFQRSDIVTLHCPLVPQTHHLVDSDAVAKMRKGVMLINTSRGALVDTRAVIDALKSGKIGWLGLDVYEEEGGLFFEDLSEKVIQDDVFARLLTFPNVVVTGHQAFFTKQAIQAIAETTLGNVAEFEETGRCENEVRHKA